MMTQGNVCHGVLNGTVSFIQDLETNFREISTSYRAYQESSTLTCYPCSSSQHPPRRPRPHAYGSRGLGKDRRGNDQKEIELSRFLGCWSSSIAMACFCAPWGTICYFSLNNLEILEACKNRIISFFLLDVWLAASWLLYVQTIAVV